jgi:hypothetical protein
VQPTNVSASKTVFATKNSISCSPRTSHMSPSIPGSKRGGGRTVFLTKGTRSRILKRTWLRSFKDWEACIVLVSPGIAHPPTFSDTTVQSSPVHPFKIILSSYGVFSTGCIPPSLTRPLRSISKPLSTFNGVRTACPSSKMLSDFLKPLCSVEPSRS